MFKIPSITAAVLTLSFVILPVAHTSPSPFVGKLLHLDQDALLCKSVLDSEEIDSILTHKDTASLQTMIRKRRCLKPFTPMREVFVVDADRDRRGRNHLKVRFRGEPKAWWVSCSSIAEHADLGLCK
jgi:hypothetical protein